MSLRRYWKGMQFFGRRPLWMILWFVAFMMPPALSHGKTLKMSEADVIVVVLRQNLGVLAQALDPKIAQTFVTEVMAQFDLLIDGTVSYQIDQSDKQSIVFGTDNRTAIWRARASKRLPYGVEASLGLSNQHDTTNSAFATDPEFFETRLTLGARANFLRNRFGKSDQGEIDLTKAQTKVTTQDTWNRIEIQVTDALGVYWRLVASHYFLDIAKEFLARAQDFLRITQEKRFIGLSEDPDVLAAEALVLERQTEILRANNLIEDFREQLRTLLDFPPDLTLEPKDSLKFTPPGGLTKEKALREALSQRHDYRALREDADAKDIQIAVAKDQKWPALDLVTSLELNSVDPGYGDVLEETFSAANPNWVVGMEFNVDFENRLAKSALTRGQLEKARLLFSIKQLENDISLEIDEIFREYILQTKEVKNFTRMSTLQRQRLEIEEKNYLLGRSSSDIIVRFQTDWLDAEKERLESELRRILAWVDIRRAMATIVPEDVKKLPQAKQ